MAGLVVQVRLDVEKVRLVFTVTPSKIILETIHWQKLKISNL